MQHQRHFEIPADPRFLPLGRFFFCCCCLWKPWIRHRERENGELRDGDMAHRARLLIQSFVETGSLRTHLAAFQNASAELQSDVLTCWRTNVEKAPGIVPHMCVCAQTSSGLSGQVQLVQHGGYQMGSLHYTDSIGGPNINSSQCMKASHGPTCFVFFFSSCKIQLSCGAERQR